MIDIIQTMASNYTAFKPVGLTGKVNMVIDSKWFHVDLTGEQVTAQEGRTEGELATFSMSRDTFEKLIDGTWNALTAAGRENIRQSAPIDFQLPAGAQLTPEFMQMIYHMGMHFFKTEIPHVYNFGLKHTRKVHGGNAAALAYGSGVRFAYYTISGDEQINDGDTKDPFDQMFTVIGGQGVAQIGGIEINLQRGVAVHVPPNSTHIITASPGEQLELFWLAYGKGA